MQAQQTEYDAGLALALAATRLAPDDPHGFGLVGSICTQLAELEEERHRLQPCYLPESKRLSYRFYARAVSYLADAIQMGKTDLATIAALAKAHLRLGQYENARALEPWLATGLESSDLHSRVATAEVFVELGVAGTYDCLRPVLDCARLCESVSTRTAKLLVALGKERDAVAFCYRARRSVNSPLTAVLAVALAHTGEFETAFLQVDAALRKLPTKELYYTKAMVCLMAREPRRALVCLENALRFDQTDAVLEFAKAHALLQMGRWTEAWRYWEARWRLPEVKGRPDSDPVTSFACSFRGKRVLLTSEQGLGDTIQFSRFASLLAGQGAAVTLLCPKTLTGLMQTLPGVKSVTAGAPDSSAYDVRIPLLSLPGMFATDPETLPPCPYVSVSAAASMRWRDKMRRHEGVFKVGLVWHGNPRFPDNRRRSVPLNALHRLASVRHVQFFSLQKGDAAAQITEVAPGMELVDLAPELRDFMDTAAVLQHLDLLISVDTSVVHLAGAIGRPVWVMLAYAPGPLWMLEGDQTPFYPTARLFRQHAPNHWGAVVEQISRELAACVRSSARLVCRDETLLSEAIAGSTSNGPRCGVT